MEHSRPQLGSQFARYCCCLVLSMNVSRLGFPTRHQCRRVRGHVKVTRLCLTGAIVNPILRRTPEWLRAVHFNAQAKGSDILTFSVWHASTLTYFA